jgi:hypothetical protein
LQISFLGVIAVKSLCCSSNRYDHHRT